MKLVIGLGNPGKEYEKTRHNAGFQAVYPLLRQLGQKISWGRKFQGHFVCIDYQGVKVGLLLPMTYMNVSGESVQKCMQYYAIGPENILVITDDIDMEFGKIRFRKEGSAGGHRGLMSLIQCIGTQFSRIKVGVGKDNDAAAWVLSPFTASEQTILAESIYPLVCDRILSWVRGEDPLNQ